MGSATQPGCFYRLEFCGWSVIVSSIVVHFISCAPNTIIVIYLCRWWFYCTRRIMCYFDLILWSTKHMYSWRKLKIFFILSWVMEPMMLFVRLIFTIPKFIVDSLHVAFAIATEASVFSLLKYLTRPFWQTNSILYVCTHLFCQSHSRKLVARKFRWNMEGSTSQHLSNAHLRGGFLVSGSDKFIVDVYK
jgi:hypothetical protein